jgi:hypothetical protein
MIWQYLQITRQNENSPDPAKIEVEATGGMAALTGCGVRSVSKRRDRYSLPYKPSVINILKANYSKLRPYDGARQISNNSLFHNELTRNVHDRSSLRITRNIFVINVLRTSNSESIFCADRHRQKSSKVFIFNILTGKHVKKSSFGSEWLA